MEKKLIDYEGFEAYSNGVKDKYAEKKDIPTSLSNLQEDSTHRTVQDTEKTKWNKVTDKVDKVDGKQLSSNDYTDEDKKKVDNIPDNPKYTDTVPDLTPYAKKESIPTKISQLENDKTFKTETEIQSMIEKASSLKKEVVASLPTTGKDDVIYLVKDGKGKDNNNYLEYLWLNGKYELIGSTQVDLSGYAKKNEINKILNISNDDGILTGKNFANTYLNTKIESKVGWNEEYFPRGVFFVRMTNYNGAPEKSSDFVVFTMFNADVDEFGDMVEVHSDFIEQVAMSIKTGKVYSRYINLLGRPKSASEIECNFNTPSDDSCPQVGVQGDWQSWTEITKDFVTKDDLNPLMSTLATKEQLNAKLDKTKDKAIIDDKTDYANNTLYTTPYFVQQACYKQIGERLRTTMEMMEGALDEKINVKDIQEFTQQELEEAFK